MSKKNESFPLPNQIAWDGICRLQEAREENRSTLTIAEDDLKYAREQLREAGVDEKSEKFRDAASKMVACESLRDGIKHRLTELAKKIDAAIVAACKGEGKLFDDLDVSTYRGPLTQAEKYGTAPADTSQQTLPVGKPGRVKPEQPDASKGDGVDEHLNASINELQLTDAVTKRLAAAGFVTIAQIVKVIDSKDADHEKTLDLSGPQLAALNKKLAAFRREHRKASVEVEKVT